MKIDQFKETIEALSDGGYFLAHHARGTVSAERGALLAANKILGTPIEQNKLDNLFENAKSNEPGYVLTLIKSNCTNDENMIKIREIALFILNIVGVDNPDTIFV